MIIDTHLHMIDRERLRYPWLAQVPALDRDFPYATYAREARQAGIAAAIHMEVDVDSRDIEAETDALRGLSTEPGTLIRGAIASCRPEEASFPEYLERVAADGFVKGMRRVLHVVPDGVSEGRLFRENIGLLSGTGLPFDLCLRADQLPLGMALADAAPDVLFVLDHCGNPDIAGNADRPWRDWIAELARRSNVVAKISGVITNAEPVRWTADDLRPFVEHVIGCFGWDRVVWGSDWPVCTQAGSLSAWIAATHAILAGTSLEEREKLLAGNAKRIWKLTLPQG